MEQFKVSHLAVVKDRELIGLVSEHDLILIIIIQKKKRGIKKTPLLKPIIHNYQHNIYDLLKLMMSFNLTLIPVLDDKELYKGCITLKGLLQNISSMASVQNQGGVIVLEVNQADLFINSNISIIEGNDAKILSAHVSSVPDSTKVELLLKINKEDLSLHSSNLYTDTIMLLRHFPK